MQNISRRTWIISTIGAIIGVLLLIAVLISLSQSGDRQDSAQDNRNSVIDSQPPVLQNLGGVEFSAYDTTSGKAGDIFFTKDTLHVADGLETPIVIFGQKLPARPGEPQRINPNFEFRGIAKPIDLVSAIDGVVAFVRLQSDTSDYEVFFSTSEQSNWIISYDHVTDLLVKQGDSVKVGQKIGKAALERDRYYRYEIQINREGSNDNTTMACPTTLLSAAAKTKFTAQFLQLEKDWQQWYGKNTFPTNIAGCVKESLTVQESEGR